MKHLIYLLLVLITLFYIHKVEAQELPKELSMKTDVGEVILTTEHCYLKEMGLDFPYEAYATEQGHANHVGCWKKEDAGDGMGTVKIYFPEIDATALYNPMLFRPRGK